MSLIDKLKKTSTIDISGTLDDSEIFGERQVIQTEIPILNIALQGELGGGLTSGVTMIAGPSKHFKSMIALFMMRAFQKKYSDGAVLFYDSEFGTPKGYFESFDIDMSRVLHTPIVDVEQLKHDIMTQLKEFKRGDKVLVVIDSLGQLASVKEVDDALEGKTVADMTRAKSIKSLFRMVTPHLRIKDIPLVAVNHTYQSLGLYPKDIVSGGLGSYYAADTIWIIGRQQEKLDGEVAGFNFVLNVEKSRFVKEKSKFSLNVMFEGGLEKHSGLLEIALDGGFITKPSPGWYLKKGTTTKVRESETKTVEFWKDILSNGDFNEFIKRKYLSSYGDILEDTGEST